MTNDLHHGQPILMAGEPLDGAHIDGRDRKKVSPVW